VVVESALVESALVGLAALVVSAEQRKQQI